jgi:hypothetical protein
VIGSYSRGEPLFVIRGQLAVSEIFDDEMNEKGEAVSKETHTIHKGISHVASRVVLITSSEKVAGKVESLKEHGTNIDRRHWRESAREKQRAQWPKSLIRLNRGTAGDNPKSAGKG